MACGSRLRRVVQRVSRGRVRVNRVASNHGLRRPLIVENDVRRGWNFGIQKSVWSLYLRNERVFRVWVRRM